MNKKNTARFTMQIFLTATILIFAATAATAQTVPSAETRSQAVSAAGEQILQRDVPKLELTRAVQLRRVPFVNPNATLIKNIADNIEKRLKNKAVGYSFQVAYKDTNLVEARAGGAARRAPDSNPRPFRTDDRISIASVSKTITAITLLKLLNEKSIDVDASIAPYLPKSIKPHSSIQTITFRELLTHTSGIRWAGEPDYALMVKDLAEGINPANKKKNCKNNAPGVCYNNTNFGLMRILIPYIENGYEPPANTNDYAKSYLYGIKTMDATYKRVFEPLGIKGVFCTSSSDGNAALSYQFPQPIQKGQDWGDMTATNAYRGWNLSASQMSKVIGALVFGEKLMPAALRDKMLSEQLGIWHSDVNGLDEFSHGGWHPGNPTPGQYNLGEVGTVIVAYSNGISVALMVNSQFGPGLSTLDAIRPAIAEEMAKAK